MDDSLCYIPARSERQAMDWSLVLTSQDIVSTLIAGASEGGWGVAVAPEDYAKALEALCQYQRENRGWGWRQPVAATGVWFHWGVLGWDAVLVGVALMDWRWDGAMQAGGLLDSRLVWSGQWWRLFTALTLHADAGHLASNLSIGSVFLGLAMARYGPGFALWAVCLAGALGNVLGLLVYSGVYRGLGASGMVMGALGLVAVQSWTTWRGVPGRFRWLGPGILAGGLLFTLLGLNPESDVVAHLGGFLAGLGLGWLGLQSAKWGGDRPEINRWLVAALAIWVGVTWGLALRPFLTGLGG